MFPSEAHMDQVAALAALNRRVLAAYSVRTSRALADALPVRMAIPHIEAVLAFNVGKEIEKDTLVIREAARAAAFGKEVTADTVRHVLRAARDIDRAFLGRIGRLPLGIVIPYEEIEPVRRRRVERLAQAAHRMFSAWPEGAGLRTALQQSYTRAELEGWLGEWLRLYAAETQVLSRAVRLPVLLVPVRERIASGLYRVMHDVAARLAHAAAVTVFRK
jgi:hypothetical protein